MSDSPAPKTVSLDALRRDIDAADQEMHRQLMHRGELIEQLIEAKRLGPRGAAFRPDREADMMRRIAARHAGRLPLSTVEHIWREIIGTFTQLQAPYRVFAARAGEAEMRDLLRYFFGFTIPLMPAATNREAVETVARSGADLAVVAVDDPLEERWWRGFISAESGALAAKIIAFLPFLPLSPGLDLPRAFVIGPADVDAPADLNLYALELDGAASADGIGTVLTRSDKQALVASALSPDDFAKQANGASWLGSVAAPTYWT
jgi:chorismate mutase / prephenate dehydratase